LAVPQRTIVLEMDCEHCHHPIALHFIHWNAAGVRVTGQWTCPHCRTVDTVDAPAILMAVLPRQDPQAERVH